MSQDQNSPQPLAGYFLGRRDYAPIHDLMRGLFEARREGRIGDTVLLLEHSPVITFGRGAKAENVIANAETLKGLGVSIEETGRGGDVTLHAPGQLIAYPIIDLKPDRCDVRKYVQGLTRVMASLVKPYGLDGGTICALIGLWLDTTSLDEWPGEEKAQAPAKIGAIGVRISRWITQHGFALNLTTDLSLFQLIVPCGIQEHGVASVQSLTGEKPDLPQTAALAFEGLNREFGAPGATYSDASAVIDEDLADWIQTRQANSVGG